MLLLSEETAKVFDSVKGEIRENDRIKLTYDSEHNRFRLDSWCTSLCTNWNGETTTTYVMPGSGTRTIIKRCKDIREIHSNESPFAYNVAATDINCEIIAELFPVTQLQFANDESRITFESLVLRSRAADVAAMQLAKYQATGELPEMAYDCEISAENPLSAYQLLPLANLKLVDGYGLFMEMGTGKTPVVIARVCNMVRDLQATGESRHLRVIIVCPNNARANWASEFDKFATVKTRCTIARGTNVDRIMRLADMLQADENIEASVLIVGIDTITPMWTEGLNQIPFDLAVADEGHYFKSTKTKRYQTMMKLRDNSAQRITLTGTPMANTVVDYFAQFEFMGKGYSGFNSVDQFRNFYVKFEEQYGGGYKVVGSLNMPFLRERLARYSYKITKAEALPNMPGKVNDIYECEMSEKQREYYDELRDSLMIQIENELASDKPKSLIANNILTQLLRLAQITSGFLSFGAMFDDFGNCIAQKEIQYIYPNPKLNGLCELLADKAPTSKTLIWTCFTPDIVQISDMLTYNGIDHVVFNGSTSADDRIEAERRFNYDDNCKVFLGNSLAGGTALNLLGFPPNDPSASECNADHTIYYSQNWSRTTRVQSGDRNYRRGTRVQIRETDLVIPRTIDEEIRARVVQKTTRAIEASDISEIIRKLSAK